MNTRQIEFEFKGARNYIQGPDIVNAMLVEFPPTELSNIRFSAHEFVSVPRCTLYHAISKEELAGLDGICARCQFDHDGVTHWLALVPEGGDAATAARCDYDEALVVSLCRMSGESVSLAGPRPFSFIETIVSMNKYMHQQLFPEAKGKWIFTRIDLQRGCDAAEGISLQLQHNLNFRLTKTDILVGGEKVGDLYFSLIKA